jgi:mRNA interferase MazF
VTRPDAVARGEVWLAALDPTLASEIQQACPCVIISPSEPHDFLRTVTVAPMTTGSRPAPYRIPVRFRRKHGLILLDQVRTLDRMRLVRRLGAVGTDTLRVARDVRGVKLRQAQSRGGWERLDGSIIIMVRVHAVSPISSVGTAQVRHHGVRPRAHR